jgi:8-oxo-dGTP pyrophosphatase MutT (NUDIX family)
MLLPEVSVVMVLDQDDHVLVIRRCSDDPNKGKWESPAGHRDSGESPEEAATREVHEETGLKVKLLPHTQDTTSPQGKKLRMFVARVNRSKPKVKTNPKEHDDHKWVHKDSIHEVKPTHAKFGENLHKLLTKNQHVKEGAMFNPNPMSSPMLPGALTNFRRTGPLTGVGANPNPAATVPKVAPVKADGEGAQQTLAKLASLARSASGEGKHKYKIDTEQDAKGQAAFDTVDKYMRKVAGMNEFQAQFFGRLVSEGHDPRSIEGIVKRAGNRFGDKVTNELLDGLEKLSFAWMGQAARAAGKGIANAWGKAVPAVSNAASQVAERAVPMAQKAVTTTKNFGKGLIQGRHATDDAGRLVGDIYRGSPGVANMSGSAATRSMNPGLGAGQATNQFMRQLPKTVPQTLGKAFGPGMGQYGRQGALTGAMNPYTGLMSNNLQWNDADGNFSMGELGNSAARIGMSTALGAAGGRILGATPLARASQAAQGRMLAGSGAGYTAGMLGEAAGVPGMDGVTGAQLGGALGMGAGNKLSNLPGLKQLAQNPSTPKAVSGLLNRNTGSAMTRLDPTHWIGKGIGKGMNAVGNSGVGQFVKANPLGTAGLGMGAAGLGLGGAALGMAPGLVDQHAQTHGRAMGDQLMQNPEVQQLLGQGRDMVSRGNSLMDQGQQALGNVNGLFGGGQGGGQGGGGLAGLLGAGGQLGEFWGQNKNWLMPLLLGGGGAALGYGLGGGTGAAMGGVGLPLLHYLASNGHIPGVSNLFQGQQAQGQGQEQPGAAPPVPQGQQQAEAAVQEPNEIQRQAEMQQMMEQGQMPPNFSAGDFGQQAA